MKNCLAPAVVLFCLMSCLQVAGQQQPIRFANGEVIPTPNIQNRSFRKEQLPGMLFDNKLYGVVQFAALPSPQLRQRLGKAGITLGKYIPGKAYFASLPINFDASTAAALDILSISPVPGFYKFDIQLSELLATNPKHPIGNIAVDLFQDTDREKAIQEIMKLGATIVPTKFDAVGLLFILADSAAIAAVAGLPFVSSLSLKILKDEPLNYKNVASHGVSGLNAPGGKNLNGKGVTIGIGDNADIASHVDFTGRLINRSHGIAVDHGTHVSGTAAGAGIINVKNHGIAPKAKVVS